MLNGKVKKLIDLKAYKFNHFIFFKFLSIHSPDITSHFSLTLPTFLMHVRYLPGPSSQSIPLYESSSSIKLHIAQLQTEKKLLFYKFLAKMTRFVTIKLALHPRVFHLISMVGARPARGSSTIDMHFACMHNQPRPQLSKGLPCIIRTGRTRDFDGARAQKLWGTCIGTLKIKSYR